jgi:hypothetical protein
VTPAEIDRLLSKARRDLAEAEKAAANIEWLKASIIQLEAMRDEARRRMTEAESIREEHAKGVLHNRHERATVNDTMDTQKHGTKARVPGQRLKTKAIAAVRIRAVDGSVNAFALKHKLPVTTVRSWYATEESARKIPKEWADKLSRKPYSIPTEAWPNGIADEGE